MASKARRLALEHDHSNINRINYMKILKVCVLIVGTLATSLATALNTGQLVYLQSAVLEMCRGGTIEGKSSKINVKASVQGQLVVIKKLLEGGADAEVEITKEEWDGIKALANPEDYSKCVEATLNLLVPRLDNQS